MYLHRVIEPHLLRLSRSFPVTLLTGPRQSGKTTLLRHLAAEERRSRSYVSLDELGPRSLAERDPGLFLQRYPPPALIDEVQNAPQLLAALKPLVDQRGANGLYWLTGSQQFSLMKEVSESLAGRVGLLELGNLSSVEERQGEAPELPFRPDRVEPSRAKPLELLPLFERIVRGGFPRLRHPDAPPWESFYGSYLATYVERDIRSLLDISDLAAFRRFLRVAAARTGQLLNLSDLARDVGIAASTARSWIDLLEATFQVYLLRPYFENLGKRQIKTPKLYFRDTGLVAYLTGWTSAEAASVGAMAGPLLECWVVSELLKSYHHRGREAPLWFFRTKEAEEVDVLIAEDGRLFPLEVKLSSAPSPRDLRGIRALERTGAAVGAGAVLCLARDPFPLTDSVTALPVSVLA